MEKNNLEIYELLKEVPDKAKKTITGQGTDGYLQAIDFLIEGR